MNKTLDMSLGTVRRSIGGVSRRQIQENVKGYLFVLPWIISLVIFTVYPMVASFYFSMTNYTILNPPQWVGLHNFEVMLTQDPLYWKSVYNSAYYATFAVPLQLIVALVLALLLNQKVRGIGFYRTAYYLPALMPTVASTLLWMFLLDPRFGLVNAGLRLLGLPRLGWLRSAAWSKPGLILMSVWTGSGWRMLIFLAALKEIPQSLYESAMIDGANSWQRFRFVTIPLLTPAIFFNLVMGIIDSFQVFTSAFVAAGVSDSASMGTAGPLNSLLVYMLLLYRYGFRYFEMGYASAMALVLFIALLVITAVLVKSSGRWVYYEKDGRRS
jgi:multiple sugar transport system permease protein